MGDQFQGLSKSTKRRKDDPATNSLNLPDRGFNRQHVANSIITPINSRDCDTQTLTNLDCDTLNVDLDALENSDGEMSAHSSTSGVSSLLPKYISKPRPRPRLDQLLVSGTVGQRNCVYSDAAESITSESTYRSPSITPWIMSLKSKAPDSPESTRPSKRQRLSSGHSQCSSILDDKHSLFYRAKTTYGGAASCRSQGKRNELFQPNIPLRFELESSAPSISSETPMMSGANLSSTARRILESLERFSTPLTVADRVPLPSHADRSNHYTPSTMKRTFRSHRFPPYMQTYSHLRSAQRRKLDIPVSSCPVDPPLSDCRTNTSEDNTSSSFPLSQPKQVPTNFQSQRLPPLPVSNRPPVSSKSIVGTSSNVNVTQSVYLPTSTRVGIPTSVAFTFASPIRRPPSVASQLVGLASDSRPIPSYTFSAPDRPSRSASTICFSRSQTATVTSHESTTTPAFPSTALSSPIFNMLMDSSNPISKPSTVKSIAQTPVISKPLGLTWRCESCLMENPELRDNCSSCSIPRLKTTSRTLQSSHIPTDSISSKWECSTCSVFNKVVDNACVACGNKNLGPMKTKAPSGIMPCEQKWECPTCMVFNDNQKTSCLCCQTPKPGVKKTNTSSQPVQTNGNWECPTCMVSNSSDKTNCPCCATPKPGSSAKSASSNFPALSMGITPSTNSFPFKFGTSAVAKSKEPASGVTFSFGLQTAKSSTSFDLPTASVASSSMATVQQTPLPVFKFGAYSSTSESSSISNTIPSMTTVPEPTSSSQTSQPFSFSQSKPATTNSVVTSMSEPATTRVSPGKRTLATEHSSAPKVGFQFGLPMASKIAPTATNGLVNGGVFPTKTTSVSSGFNFASTGPTATSGFDFNTPKSVPGSGGIVTSLPFVFGSSIAAETKASMAPPVVPAVNNVAQILGKSTSSPFMFGASEPAFSTSAAAPPAPSSGLFCFGASSNSTGGVFSQSSPSVAATTILNHTPLPTTNLFSASSTTGVPLRKKAHAVRRLQR